MAVPPIAALQVLRGCHPWLGLRGRRPARRSVKKDLVVHYTWSEGILINACVIMCVYIYIHTRALKVPLIKFTNLDQKEYWSMLLQVYICVSMHILIDIYIIYIYCIHILFICGPHLKHHGAAWLLKPLVDHRRSRDAGCANTGDLLVKIEGPGAGIPSIIICLLLKGFLQTTLLINQPMGKGHLWLGMGCTNTAEIWVYQKSTADIWWNRPRTMDVNRWNLGDLFVEIWLKSTSWFGTKKLTKVFGP